MTEKYPGHYETVKCFELVNNYNCSKKHKCLKKILDETKIYDIIKWLITNDKKDVIRDI